MDYKKQCSYFLGVYGLKDKKLWLQNMGKSWNEAKILARNHQQEAV